VAEAKFSLFSLRRQSQYLSADGKNLGKIDQLANAAPNMSAINCLGRDLAPP